MRSPLLGLPDAEVRRLVSRLVTSRCFGCFSTEAACMGGGPAPAQRAALPYLFPYPNAACSLT
jgi:hypothetical protein